MRRLCRRARIPWFQERRADQRVSAVRPPSHVTLKHCLRLIVLMAFNVRGEQHDDLLPPASIIEASIVRRRPAAQEPAHMRQLSKNDALFLASESAHSNSNVSLITIYDPSTAPGGRLQFKSILALVQSRLHRSPVFRQKLRSVPFGLDEPYWIEDENFDLEYHVRNIALPKPGDWRQFCIQTSRIHARPLDLNRPLWELYVIEGLDAIDDLPKDSFALLTKLHNAAIDVKRGTAIITLLHDTTPQPLKAEPPEPWFPESPPGSLELVCRGLASAVASPRRLARPFTSALAGVAPAARSFASELLQRQEASPVTRFNSIVSPYRVFETRRF